MTPGQCSYCGGWSVGTISHYSLRKGQWITRCRDCDRRAFDTQMAIVIVVMVLVAALVCAWLGVWDGPGRATKYLVIPSGAFDSER